MTNFGSKVPTPKSLMGKCATGVRGGRGTIILKNNIMTTEQTKIEWENSKDELYTVVRELFKANRLRIHESCHNLIWELETYSYPDSKPDRNEEENPTKENDHAMDALRYALSMDNALTVEQVYTPMFYNTQEDLSTNPAEWCPPLNKRL